MPFCIRSWNWGSGRVQSDHPITQALEQYSSSEPAVHSGLFLNALISCAPWGGLLAVVGVAEAGAAAAVEQSKYTYEAQWLYLWTPKLYCIMLLCCTTHAIITTQAWLQCFFFIYILDSSKSSSTTFWTSQFGSRSNWTGIWTGNSKGSWTDKQSSHFSRVKEMSVKAVFFFM